VQSHFLLRDRLGEFSEYYKRLTVIESPIAAGLRVRRNSDQQIESDASSVILKEFAPKVSVVNTTLE
jgi:hypothetical protein